MHSTSNSLHPLGRYSFLMANPVEYVTRSIGSGNPFRRVKEILQNYQLISIPELPPFQGGLAGLLSYDLNQSLEKIPNSQIDEFGIPALAVGWYDTLIAWDHEQDRSWIISTGLPASDAAGRNALAKQRIEHWLDCLQVPAPPPPAEVEIQRIRPQASFPIGGPEKLTSNFAKADYLNAVQACIDYIYAGDVFQINLAQRLLSPVNCDATELFARLRRCNPAPFSGYFDLRGFGVEAEVISASPERFFSVRDRVVETRPIKGTWRRTGTPMVDIYAKSKLQASTKDRAENVMIVDLMRNDLSRCCLDESIRVTQLCELEEYKSVMHLVSAVQGRLKPDNDLVDLLESVFPGGSITGAPKIRAMEIIAELEPHSRGAYCGALGYLGFNGNADFSILIRTITAAGGWWQIPVGGGIVSQSKPISEYEETWTKAAGMLRAVNQ